MKKLMSIIIVLLLAGFVAFGQQSGKERKAAAEKKAAAQRERSMGGFRTENDLKDDKGAVPETKSASDSGRQVREQQTAAPAAEVVPSNKDQQKSTADNSGNNAADAEKSNAPAIIQRTTSESGSPSILSGDNGRERDGTNNVQRSTINMAGAEVPGDMGLSRKNGSERNMNTGAPKIRKQEEQPQKTISKQEQARNKQQVSAQQRSANEEKEASGDKKKSKKTSKKNRRSRDSG